MRISDWSSDVCSSDLSPALACRDWHLGDRPRTRRLGGTARSPVRRRRASPCSLSGLDAAMMFLREYRSRAACLADRSEEHTSELQSLMRISYAVFCLKKKNTK